MAFDKYSNKEEIISSNNPVIGNKWPQEIATNSSPPRWTDLDIKVDANLYSITDQPTFINSVHDIEWKHNKLSHEFIQVSDEKLRTLFGIHNGKYHVEFTFHKHLAGSPDKPALYIEEISPDRTELHLKSIIRSEKSYRFLSK